MSVKRSAARLGELLTRSDETIELFPDAEYREVTVRLWGRGVVERRRVTGVEIAGGRRFVTHAEQFIASRIDARNGAMGIVPTDLDGAIVTNDFPLFNVRTDRLLPAFLGWLCRTLDFVELCQRASEGTTNRVRLKEERFLSLEVPLPPLAEQRRIVARIEELAAQINEARTIRDDATSNCDALLMSAYRQITVGAQRKPLSEVAPLERRPARIDVEATYPQIAVRSFGRGTFHKPPLSGSQITWEKPHLVRAGDILISNIKAWEGAIAVARPEDDGRFGSHRYLTCIPAPNVATARFVCFHLLTAEGLYDVGEASPGSADRNRTLGARELMKINVPTPEFHKQVWFDKLDGKVGELKRLQAETATELDALLPSILDKAFKGEL
jgi:type I restriction enzyme S subunit